MAKKKNSDSGDKLIANAFLDFIKSTPTTTDASVSDELNRGFGKKRR